MSKVRDNARGITRRLSVPKSLKKIAEMPLTMMGLGIFASAVTMLTVVGGLMFIGIALIGVEYLITGED